MLLAGGLSEWVADDEAGFVGRAIALAQDDDTAAMLARLRAGLRQRLRGAAESIRREVMARGWHEHPVTGPALRWINRHLPW